MISQAHVQSSYIALKSIGNMVPIRLTGHRLTPE